MPDWSDDKLRVPIEMADSFDFSEGDIGKVPPIEWDGVSNPLEVGDAAERVLVVE